MLHPGLYARLRLDPRAILVDCHVISAYASLRRARLTMALYEPQAGYGMLI
jgi:hypothetical protein